jgi:hypothetical protein
MKRLVQVGFALLLLGGCTGQDPKESDPKESLVGRWESATLTVYDEPIFVQFDADGTMTHSGNYGLRRPNGNWMILDSGQLQVTYPGGDTRRCKATVKGKSLTISPAKCFLLWDWNELGSSIELNKQ